MSVLVIGGDDFISIKSVLYNLGAKKITHWDSHKDIEKETSKLPVNIDFVLMMTDFISKNMSKKYREMAKENDIKLICTRRSVSCVYSEFCKALGKDFGCPFNK